MSISPDQLKKVFVNDCAFSQLGFSMLITRLKKIYNEDPSEYTLKSCTSEVNAFLSRYSGIMGKDFEMIIGL